MALTGSVEMTPLQSLAFQATFSENIFSSSLTCESVGEVTYTHTHTVVSVSVWEDTEERSGVCDGVWLVAQSWFWWIFFLLLCECVHVVSLMTNCSSDPTV